MSWPLAKLGELSQINAGNSAPQGQDDFSDIGTPFIRAGSLARLLQGATDHLETIDEADAKRPKLKLFPKDAILFAKSGMSCMKGYVYRLPFDAHVVSHLAIVQPGPELFPAYAEHALRVFSPVLLIKDESYPSIRLPEIANLEIPLPPLDEQKRIAGILDHADALRRLRSQALDTLNTLGQAIFHEMFGNDQYQRNKPLSEIAELINGDRSSNYPSGDDIKEDGILFLSTKNISNWRLNLSRTQYISEKKFQSLSRGKLQRGDIVITLRGTLGQAALFDCGYDTGFINAQMMIIRPRDGISPQYLLDFLALNSTQNALFRGQSGSAVKQLTANQVGRLSVVVPSREKQVDYEAKIALSRRAHEAILSYTEKLDVLFTSLQHSAFRGEL